MDIKNVLVPTDFSVPSKMAVNYGIALARKFRARLTLMHVLGVKPLLSNIAEIDPHFEEKLGQEALQQLAALVAPEDEDDLDLQTVIKFGGVQKAIINVVKEQHADIIVLGTHGHGRIGRLVLGSTTERVLRKLGIPVMTVRETRAMTFKRILLATDLSESSTRALDFALNLAHLLRTDVVAVHTLDKQMMSSIEDAVRTELHDLALQQARQKLAMIVTEGRRRGIEISTLLREGTAADEILKTAEDVDADLILLATTRKGAVERILIGATAERVVREARIPVLCVPAKVPAQPEAVSKTS
jgi:nucleotide-binding universal stress UspA family protein